MRWDKLFDDLESQLEQELTAEEVDLRAEEERLRLSRLTLRDRLVALDRRDVDPRSRLLRLSLVDGSRIAVTPSTFGRDWLAGDLHDDGLREWACIVPFHGIAGIVLARDQVFPSLDARAPEESTRSLSARLGLAFVLRDLCRRRQALELRLADGTLHGTLDRVGRDHCDLAVHEPGGVRRESAVLEYRVVRLDQILFLRL